jgi:hypothetical protein
VSVNLQSEELPGISEPTISEVEPPRVRLGIEPPAISEVPAISDILIPLRKLSQQLGADEALAARFAREPKTVLAEHDTDFPLPLNTGSRTLGDVLASVEPEARVATVDSILRFARTVPL